MKTLSICTIAQDEEEPIQWYLECCAYLSKDVGDLLREVVLVDGGSKDNTIDVINSYKTKIPLRLEHRPFDTARRQMDYGQSLCTGDMIFCPDADMTWTKNFGAMLKDGYFDGPGCWLFYMMFTAVDAYHFFNKWTVGTNLRMYDARYRWNPNREYHVLLDVPDDKVAFCPSMVVFENSGRIANTDALLNRGVRRQQYRERMHLEGMGPGAETRFVDLQKNIESGVESVALLPDNILKNVLSSTNTKGKR